MTIRIISEQSKKYQQDQMCLDMGQKAKFSYEKIKIDQ